MLRTTHARASDLSPGNMATLPNGTITSCLTLSGSVVSVSRVPLISRRCPCSSCSFACSLWTACSNYKVCHGAAAAMYHLRVSWQARAWWNCTACLQTHLFDFPGPCHTCALHFVLHSYAGPLTCTSTS